MKILIHSNAPWNPTGYGGQAAQLSERLAAAGHEVAISCMTGLQGQPTRWHGILCLPIGLADYSNDTVLPHARQFFKGDPGLILTIYDTWCLDPGNFVGIATASWAPVHSHGMSVGDRMFFRHSHALPIAISKHGQEQMLKAAEDTPDPAGDYGSLHHALYIPHGIDTAVFRPLTEDGVADARDRLGLPQDAFVVAMVAMNKGSSPARKAWSEALQGFAAFWREHPEARLFLHTLVNGGGHGIDLGLLIDDLGIGEAVHFADQYGQVTGTLTPHYVAAVLGCADVFLNPSMGEGFGLPSVEAQACGTPVILGDNSAQRELCGSGWLVDCQPEWHPGDGAYWHRPLLSSVAERLEDAWQALSPAATPEGMPPWESRLVMRKAAREFAEGYDADLVFAQYWKPTLDMLEQYAGAAPVRWHGEPHTVPLPTYRTDGLRWILRGTHTGDGLVGEHEDALAPVFDEHLPEGGVFLDVGAHVGRWSLRMAGKASQVYAVEASADTAAVLEANAALNGITNITVLNLAAWDCDADLVLTDPNEQVTGGSTRVLPEAEAAEARGKRTGTTRARRLDDVLLPGRPVMPGGPPRVTPSRIDLVKIDTEGADLRVLRGMASLLDKHRPAMIIERHDIYGYYELADLKDLVAALGYRAEELMVPVTGGGMAPYLLCTRTRRRRHD